MNRTIPVCSGIPLRTEGRGPPVAAAPWTQTLNTLCAPAATWAALLYSWRSMKWRLEIYTMKHRNVLHIVTVYVGFYYMTFLFQQDPFELQLMTFLGLSLSLLCLFFCILTFSMIRSIQSPRTTIHLHLCISLFLAFLIFLTSISQTKSQVNSSLATSAEMLPVSRCGQEYEYIREMLSNSTACEWFMCLYQMNK